jgi:hypothetical protein
MGFIQTSLIYPFPYYNLHIVRCKEECLLPLSHVIPKNTAKYVNVSINIYIYRNLRTQQMSVLVLLCTSYTHVLLKYMLICNTNIYKCRCSFYCALLTRTFYWSICWYATQTYTSIKRACKKCTIKRAPTFVAYGGFYIYIDWYTRNRMHNPIIKVWMCVCQT